MNFTLSCSNGSGNPANCRYPMVSTISSKEELLQAVSADHVCADLKAHYRSKDNFLGSNVIVMDCDNDTSEENWIWMNDLEDIFGFDTCYVAVPSKNHMKQKGDKSPRPRFHVYFPIRELHNVQEYEELKKKILLRFPFFDQNAIDAVRFIYGVENPTAIWHEAPSTIDEQLIEGRILIQEGSRNATLSKFAARVLKRYGISSEAKKLFKTEADKCIPPLEHEELQQIWHSACKFYREKVLADPAYILPDNYQDPEEKPDLPEPMLLSDIQTPPAKLPELIKGVLRQGHKMLIAGPSKAGKSFLLMELAVAIAQGESWMGFPCKQGKVLYINLEIDPASCIDRFLKIHNAMNYPQKRLDNILIWNLRGHALPLDKLAPILIEKMANEDISAVIVDPIYKVITGDENNATDMGYFCNQFDGICTALGASVIYCHHHSKGSQGNKKAMDRASGSGVFARDPDAVLDIIALKKPKSQIELDEDDEEDLEEESVWRMETALREFPPKPSINFYFEHPIHRVDMEGKLKLYNAEGSGAANLASSSKRTTKEQRKKRLDEAFAELSKAGPVTIKDISEFLDLTRPTVRSYIKEFSDEYICVNGVLQERPILDQTPENSLSHQKEKR